MDRELIRKHVTGPIVSINTPFSRNGELDLGGLRAFIDRAVAAGAGTVLFTPGDSLYTVLAEREIAELTQVAARHIGQRAMFIAAAGCWWTGQTVQFLRFAREAGADAAIVFPPARGATVGELVRFYKTASEELPVFILSGSLSAVGVGAALQVVKVLVEEAPNIAGLKEDYAPEFAREACLLAHGKWAIFAGGQKQTHMDMLPYGVDGYMSVHMIYRPEIAHAYWNAVQARDLPRAASVIRDHDMPLFRFLYSEFPAGGDAAQHAVLELLGICGRWRRKPLPDLTDAEMEKLKGFLGELGIA